MNPDLYREMARTQSEHWWFRARREILERVIGRLGLPERADLLEIGTGTGGNLAMLGRYGKVAAVEMDTFASRYASEISGIRVSQGHLPDAVPFEDGTFDLVCLFDVLEHVEDDCKALQRVRALLKPGGHAIVTVPAYQWLYGPHDRAHQHFRRYTAHELVRKVRGAGLTVRKSGYFNALLFPLIAAHRLVKRAAEQESHDAALPGRLTNRLLYATFSIEKYIVPLASFPFGTSVLAVVARDDPQSSHAAPG
jgi:SAM-dependent methyltransferase